MALTATAEWLMAAFSSGTNTTIADTVASPVNMTATWGSGSWTSDAQGNGTDWAGTTQGAVSGAITSTKLGTGGLTSTKLCTFLFRYTHPASAPGGVAGIFGVGSSSFGPQFGLAAYANSATGLEFTMNDTNIAIVTVAAGTVYNVMCVLDTDQATGTDRFKVYLNGSLASTTFYSAPGLGSTVTVDASSVMFLACGAVVGYEPITAQIWYAAVCCGQAGTSGDATATDTALNSSHDVSPFAPAPTINTQPVSETLAAGGTPTALTVSATASPGGGSLSYQWELDGAGNNISGETSTTYQPPTASASENGHAYTCLVTDSNGSTRTDAATILVTTSEMTYLSADFTQVGTSFVDTGLSFPVAASTDYVFRFVLRNWCNATGTGARFQLTGPASPTSVAVGAFVPSNTGAAFIGAVTSLGSVIAATTAGRTSATPLVVIIEGVFRNGANAGTLSLQAAAEIASPGSVTVAAGSCGVIAVASGSTFCRVSSTQTTTGTTFANVSGLSFSLSASTKYRFRFVVFHTGNATGTGARFGVTAPASPTALRIGSQQNSGTAAQDSGSISSTAAAIVAATAGPGSTMTWSLIEGVIQNGSNSGTLQLQSAAEIASPGTVIVAVDSFGILEVVT